MRSNMIYIYALACLAPLIVALPQFRPVTDIPFTVFLFWTVLAAFAAMSSAMGHATDADQPVFSYFANIAIMMCVAWLLFAVLESRNAHLQKLVPITIIAICHGVVSIQAGMLLFHIDTTEPLSTAPTSWTVVLAVTSTITVMAYILYLGASLITHALRLLLRKR